VAKGRLSAPARLTGGDGEGEVERTAGVCEHRGVSAAEILAALCTAIDERRWDDLAPMLAEDFVCRYVHTGEQFDRDGWVRLNAEYPGFDHLTVEDLVDGGDRAVARCHVTGRDGEGLAHFEVATFVHARGSVLAEMTEVWTDAGQPVPQESRPS